MNRKPPNHLIPEVAGHADARLLEAAERFGTPLFLYDLDEVARCRDRLAAALPPDVALQYSVKANPCPAVIAALAEGGTGFEVSSAGELEAALRAGAAPSRCLLLGPGTTEAEMERAVSLGWGWIVAESPRQVEALDRIGRRRGSPVKAALRINPGQGGGALRMAGATQFGMDFATARRLLEGISRFPGVAVRGLQGYVGTRVLDALALDQNLGHVLAAADRLEEETGARFDFVDAGGGFGVPLYEGEAPLDLELFAEAFRARCRAYRRAHPWTGTLAVESGRYLVASSGVLLTRALDVKRTAGTRFLIVDGGLHVLGGRDGYLGAAFGPLRVVGGDQTRPEEVFTICGPLCTPADRLAARVLLPAPREGDLLAFYLAGAYGPTAAPGFFLSRGFPAEATVADGRLSLARRGLALWEGKDTHAA